MISMFLCPVTLCTCCGVYTNSADPQDDCWTTARLADLLKRRRDSYRLNTAVARWVTLDSDREQRSLTTPRFAARQRGRP